MPSGFPFRTKGRSDYFQQFFSTQSSMAAVNPGAQATATPLVAETCHIVTVPAANSGVKLPAAQAGRVITVINAHATLAINVYPFLGDQINAAGANVPFSLAAGTTAIFYCGVIQNWWQK
jgi:hypothetical protein